LLRACCKHWDWIATAYGLAMTEFVMARRYDEAIQSSA
jgi:hypothetical protein